MLVHQATADAVLRDAPLDEIEAGWRPGLDAFRAARAKYLIYPE